MAKQTALSKEPSTKLTRVSPGVYRDSSGKTVRNATGPSREQKRAAKTQKAPKTPAPPKMSEQMYQQFGQQAQQFNPATFQQQYTPQFEQAMGRARENIMGQFERRNADEFARQQQEMEQNIVERGLDPASPAAQAIRKQLSQRQDLARQEAMSAAEQASYGVQQQGFEQAQGTAMMPGAIWQQFKEPYLAQQQYGYDVKKLKAMPRGGGGGGAAQPDYFGQYMLGQLGQNYAPQQPQPDPWSQGAQGFLTGFGTGYGQRLGQGK